MPYFHVFATYSYEFCAFAKFSMINRFARLISLFKGKYRKNVTCAVADGGPLKLNGASFNQIPIDSDKTVFPS